MNPCVNCPHRDNLCNEYIKQRCPAHIKWKTQVILWKGEEKLRVLKQKKQSNENNRRNN